MYSEQNKCEQKNMWSEEITNRKRIKELIKWFIIYKKYYSLKEEMKNWVLNIGRIKGIEE